MSRTLRCATSLWSADLANLASEIRRVEPYSTRFHLDVADGHYVKNLLFFPDLVRQVRSHTTRPFEVHLMCSRPLDWIEPFAEAGANGIIFCFDSAPNPAEVIACIRARGLALGVSLRIEEPLELLDPYWPELDLVCLMGTTVGIKGAGLDPAAPGKLRRARDIIDAHGYRAELEADGGIRRDTVPLLHAAGADYIVPGSLMFGGDPAELSHWLATLRPARA